MAVTAIARKCAEIGWFHSEALADDAVNTGQVYRDGNNDVRCAGKSGVIAASTVLGTEAKAGKDALTQRFKTPERGEFRH